MRSSIEVGEDQSAPDDKGGSGRSIVTGIIAGPLILSACVALPLSQHLELLCLQWKLELEVSTPRVHLASRIRASGMERIAKVGLDPAQVLADPQLAPPIPRGRCRLISIQVLMNCFPPLRISGFCLQIFSNVVRSES